LTWSVSWWPAAGATCCTPGCRQAIAGHIHHVLAGPAVYGLVAVFRHRDIRSDDFRHRGKKRRCPRGRIQVVGPAGRWCQFYRPSVGEHGKAGRRSSDERAEELLHGLPKRSASHGGSGEGAAGCVSKRRRAARACSSPRPYVRRCGGASAERNGKGEGPCVWFSAKGDRSLARGEGGRSRGTRVGNGQQRTRLATSSMAAAVPYDSLSA